MSHEWNCRCPRCEADWRNWITLDEDTREDDGAIETPIDSPSDGRRRAD